MRLVYLSPVPWASFAQRPQKFVRWFHEKTSGDVLWLDPYPSRFPGLEDFKKIGVSDKTETDEPGNWLTVLKPKALPIEPIPGSGLINKSFYWSQLLSTIERFATDQKVLLVIGKPTTLALQVMKLLKGHPSVYDAMDDFPMFYAGFSKAAMKRRELEIGRSVKTILASSTKLHQKWGEYNENVRFVPNGLDVTLLPPAKSISESGRPKILGYLGTVGAWFDWRWIIRLAESRPDDNIHIIGPIFTPSDEMLPPNLKLFPPCSHKDAMQTMLSFDVGIIPFLKNELTSSVDPIKYYEYRAMGLPVISTGFGEMAYRGNEDGVYLCENIEQIASVVTEALRYTPTKELTDKFKIANSWEARFNSCAIIHT